mgnify:FL=1|jgi:hypothetical protein
MIAVLSKILGSGDVIKKGLDLIDDMHTSTEEEIAAKSKAKIDLMNAYAPFKLAQRYIALMFTAVFLSMFVLVLAMTLAGEGDIDAVKQIIGDFWIGEIMLMIVGFYFGGGLAESVTSAKNKK